VDVDVVGELLLKARLCICLFVGMLQCTYVLTFTETQRLSSELYKVLQSQEDREDSDQERHQLLEQQIAQVLYFLLLCIE
jgi:cell division protein FtsL